MSKLNNNVAKFSMIHVLFEDNNNNNNNNKFQIIFWLYFALQNNF